MRIYVINLDRHTQRMAHMKAVLAGIDFVRVRGVDGAFVEGPEVRAGGVPERFEAVTRYERACVASHAVAWRLLLESGASHACVLEDDVVLSPDFPRFMADADWVPDDCDVMKIETFQQRVFIGRRRTACRDRSVARLFSVHLGAAGYVISRAGARTLLAHAERPAQPIDHLMFEMPPAVAGLRVRQLMPALCIQVQNLPPEARAPEFHSYTQGQPALRQTFSLPSKIGRELTRPARQLKAALRWAVLGVPVRAEPCVVAFR